MSSPELSALKPIIRETPLLHPHEKDGGLKRAGRLVPAWIISGLVHLGIVAAFLVVSVPADGTSTSVPTDLAFFPDEPTPDDLEPPVIQPDIGDNPTALPPVMPDAIGLPNDGIPPLMMRDRIDDLQPGNTKGGLIVCGYPPSPSNPKFPRRTDAADRAQRTAANGGSAASEAAVARALMWFANHQAPDGRWSLHQFHLHGRCNCADRSRVVQNDVAATSFALLAFLGCGKTHKAGADKDNQYVKVVERGLRYLTKDQARTGELHPNMYAHGLATIALCEAYCLTSDPALRNPAQRAINYIVEAQSAEGGWRYAAKTPGTDTSVLGWQVMALKSGQMAGLSVPTETLKKAGKALDFVASPDGGGYGYTGPGETPTLSAVGLLCREYMGWGPANSAIVAGVDRLSRIGPMQNNLYYNYYGTQVLHHLGGPAWDSWNVRMREQLIATQDKSETHQLGSWVPHANDRITLEHGGRIMATSLSVLTLEVYYRHLPLYRRHVGGDKALIE